MTDSNPPTLDDLEEGTKIGYHPAGADDTRQVGIVKRVTDVNVIVTMPDDPGIEEKVAFDRIRAIEKETDTDAGAADTQEDTQ